MIFVQDNPTSLKDYFHWSPDWTIQIRDKAGVYFNKDYFALYYIHETAETYTVLHVIHMHNTVSYHSKCQSGDRLKSNIHQRTRHLPVEVTNLESGVGLPGILESLNLVLFQWVASCPCENTSHMARYAC